MMVGRDVDLSVRRSKSPPGPVLLALEGVGLAGGREAVSLEEINLEVRGGEIVGIAGVAGNGQRELAEVVAGLRPPSSGTVRIAGKDVTGAGASAARKSGLAYVPEDRLGTGLSPSLSVAENLLLTRARSFFMRRREAEEAARSIIERFEVKAPGPQTPTRELSGGNAQKVLLARELSEEPKVIVVASPTRGLDVGAAEAVRGLLDERRAAGCAVLLISEDLDEVLAMSDRILALYEGRIVYETPGEGSDVEEIGLAMAGGH